MKIALLFGSFNPVHHGHTAMAEAALQAGCDAVWFVVSPQNPLKDPSILASAEHRLAMVKLATAHEEKFVVRDDEMHLALPSYSLKSVLHFQTLYPTTEFLFLCGTDVFLQLPQWYEYESLLKRLRFLVCKRHTEQVAPPFYLQEFEKQFEFIPFHPIDLSSTLIRQQVNEKPAGIDDTVWNYIQTNKLYGVSNQ